MTVDYKLFISHNRGVLQNSTPFILDYKQNCELCFALSNSQSLGAGYYCRITDSLQQVTRLEIVGGKVILPKKLWREQMLQIIVEQTDGGKVIKLWYCQSLKLAFLDNAERATLTVGQDLSSLTGRIASLETEQLNAQDTIQEQAQIIAAQTAQIAELQSVYNDALAVISDIDRRLKTIENE